MEYKIAENSDIDAVLRLHRKYQIDTIAPEDKKDGFVTTNFDRAELESLIEREQGLFIARDGDEVVAYVMAASWDYCSKWPIFQQMIADLPKFNYLGLQLDTENSYQYGPVCVDKRYRGGDVLKEIFELARKEMAKRYPVLVTFVNQINPRSYAAHTRKLGLDLIGEFKFNGNRYWELAYDTSKAVEKTENI